MEIQFSNWSHEIDHKTDKFYGQIYTICYKSFPDGLKLILDDDSGLRIGFKMIENL